MHLIPGGNNRVAQALAQDHADIRLQQMEQALEQQNTRIADLALVICWFLSKQPKDVAIAIPLAELRALKGLALSTRPVQVPDTTQPADEHGRSPIVDAVALSAVMPPEQPKVIVARPTNGNG